MKWISVFALFCLVFLVAIFFGSENLSIENVIILRLPRVIFAVAIGGGLAASGLVLQTVLQNPLSDPYILGISSAAAVGAALSNALGLSMHHSVFVSLLFAAMLTFVLLSLSKRLSAQGVLLVGISLNFFFGGLLSAFVTLSSPSSTQQIVNWLYGDLGRFELNFGLFVLIIVLLQVFLLFTESRKLDLLYLGEEGAMNSGVDVKRTKSTVILLSSLIVALSVSSCGMIGFVGLVIPHLLRIAGVIGHRFQIICSFLVGSIFLIICDWISRVVAAPVELSVGTVTALFGAPLFGLLLWRSRGFRS